MTATHSANSHNNHFFSLKQSSFVGTVFGSAFILFLTASLSDLLFDLFVESNVTELISNVRRTFLNKISMQIRLLEHEYYIKSEPNTNHFFVFL